MKKNSSLTLRIALLTFFGIFVSIVTAVGSINWAFNRSIERSLHTHLVAYIDILIAATEFDQKGNIKLDKSIELLDKTPWLWQITSCDEGIIKSPTLENWIPCQEDDPNVPMDAPMLFEHMDGSTKITATQKTITFPGDKSVTYSFGMQKVIADVFIQEERKVFLGILGGVMVLLAVVFILLAAGQMHLSISPLTRIKNAIKKIRAGKIDRLEGVFPKEIQMLTDELNRLLDYSTGVIERYRTFTGNLSHSLKTPIAVMYNEANKEDSKFARTVKEKSDDMLSLIDRNLARVKVAGTVNILGARTEVLSNISKISRSFGKFYRKEVKLDCGTDLFFRGDEGDFYEMLGMTIENACKYSESQVEIQAFIKNDQLNIIIEDDGAGIPEDQYEKVFERGTRLDQSRPGSGIGMSVTKSIVELYSGSITLGKSKLGGLKLEFLLPTIS